MPVVVELVEDMVEVKEEDGVAGKEEEEEEADGVAAEAGIKEEGEDGAERGAVAVAGVIAEDGMAGEAGAEGEEVARKISSLLICLALTSLTCLSTVLKSRGTE
jgi:hypothetical protein